MTGVLLGVFDGYMPIERNILTSETKIGGTPTYFPTLSDEQTKIIRDWTTCAVCGHPMFLLLQAFSPFPSVSALHHRMVYVFCCNSAECVRQPSCSWCAFTLQVDTADEKALQDDDDNNENEEDVLQYHPLLANELPPNTFPPCFVDIVPEPKKEIVVPTSLEAEMIQAAEANAKNSGITENDVKELEETVDLKDKPSDYEFEKFRKRMAREPAQVLRYYIREATGKEGISAFEPSARPLFMNSQNVKDSVRIPPCSSCGAALIHELQLMPTCVYYLRAWEYTGPGKSKADEGVDWGSVTVFVCSNDCSKNSQGVVLQKAFVLVEKAPELEDEVREANGRQNLRLFMGSS